MEKFLKLKFPLIAQRNGAEKHVEKQRGVGRTDKEKPNRAYGDDKHTSMQEARLCGKNIKYILPTKLYTLTLDLLLSLSFHLHTFIYSVYSVHLAKTNSV